MGKRNLFINISFTSNFPPFKGGPLEGGKKFFSHTALERVLKVVDIQIFLF